MKGLFITSTGTGNGKTFVTRGLARALTLSGIKIDAIKPVETGCSPDPQDAIALARACGNPLLASAPGLYRAAPPLAPYAVTLRTGLPQPDIEQIAARVVEIAGTAEIALVEGAGGLLVPVDRHRTIADLVRALELPMLVVARDCLGLLSHALTLFESARARRLPIAALVLTRHEPQSPRPVPDPGSNREILAERLEVPVLGFGFCDDDDDCLARAALESGLVDLVRRL